MSYTVILVVVFPACVCVWYRKLVPQRNASRALKLRVSTSDLDRLGLGQKNSKINKKIKVVKSKEYNVAVLTVHQSTSRQARRLPKKLLLSVKKMLKNARRISGVRP